jgi:methylenetetrahydrofolate--tRNA-(uracil-5-)-methyltransferase
LAARIGSDSLAYYDAIAPIVSAESIDWSRVFRATRWDKGKTEAEQTAYVNCPMDEPTYKAFHAALMAARKVEPKPFEKTRYFEGCLPIEVMAARGEKTLTFGPMKPVGLTDPKTGRWPHAVVQLRQEDEAATAYNLVGFQTRMAWGDQAQVLKMIPGLEQAEFLRMGAVHRNTFVNAPRALDDNFRLLADPGISLAGQITGTEGYVESAAGGWLVAYFVACRLAGREPSLPPETTAHGGLITQTRRHPDDYQPSNITFSHIAPWQGTRLKKRARYEAIAERALSDLAAWVRTAGCALTA